MSPSIILVKRKLMLNTQQIFGQELYSPGYLLIDVPHEHREGISNSINEIIAETDITEDVRSFLRGHISHQFAFPLSEEMQSFLIELTAQYHAKFGSHPDMKYQKKPPVYESATSWVNFQKKGEFNPIHSHSGSFSWVMWIRCPYKIADEQARYGDINQNESAAFNFHYVDAYGDIAAVNLPVDEEFEWKMAFFPSRLSHSVNPFMTSDDFRISISGNIIAK